MTISFKEEGKQKNERSLIVTVRSLKKYCMWKDIVIPNNFHLKGEESRHPIRDVP